MLISDHPGPVVCVFDVLFLSLIYRFYGHLMGLKQNLKVLYLQNVNTNAK